MRFLGVKVEPQLLSQQGCVSFIVKVKAMGALQLSSTSVEFLKKIGFPLIMPLGVSRLILINAGSISRTTWTRQHTVMELSSACLAQIQHVI